MSTRTILTGTPPRWTREPETPHEPGDLIAIPVNGRWVIAVVREVCPTVASWGDFEAEIAPWTGIVARREWMLPSAGLLVGRAYDTPEALRDELSQHRRA